MQVTFDLMHFTFLPTTCHRCTPLPMFVLIRLSCYLLRYGYTTVLHSGYVSPGSGYVLRSTTYRYRLHVVPAIPPAYLILLIYVTLLRS